MRLILLLLGCVQFGPMPPDVTPCTTLSECDNFDCTAWEEADPTCNFEVECVEVDEHIGVCDCGPTSCR